MANDFVDWLFEICIPCICDFLQDASEKACNLLLDVISFVIGIIVIIALLPIWIFPFVFWYFSERNNKRMCMTENKKITELYKNNADFRQYVDRYCKSYNLSVEEALKHVIVGEVAKEYAEETENDR